jgi:hypothetical protein
MLATARQCGCARRLWALPVVLPRVGESSSERSSTSHRLPQTAHGKTRGPDWQVVLPQCEAPIPEVTERA